MALPWSARSPEWDLIVNAYEVSSGCVSSRLDGWISPHASEWLLEQTEVFLGAGAKFIVFECDRLAMFNTPAVGFFMETRRRLKRVDGFLALVRLKSEAKEKLLLSGPTAVFSVFEAKGDAIKALEADSRAWAAEADRRPKEQK